MTMPQSPPKPGRSYQFTNATAATAFSPAIGWVQMIVAGNLVMVDQAGNAVSYTNLPAGMPVPGPFSAFTSTTSTQIILGDGATPEPLPSSAIISSTTAGNGADAVGYPDLGGFTAQTTTGGAVNEIFASLKATDGIIPLPAPQSFYLLTGAPLAIFAGGASSVPGSVYAGSKCVGIQWNNDATPAAVATSFCVPPDMDITANAVVHFQVAKTGATNNAGNTTTMAVEAFNQVDGALYDADADFGGTSSALLPAATAKTIQNLTLTLALANLAAYPARVTLTVKPTAGTLDTDDLVFLGAYIVYTKKLTS